MFSTTVFIMHAHSATSMNQNEFKIKILLENKTCHA